MKNLEIKVVKLKGYENIEEIVKMLRNNMTVYMNCEEIDIDMQKQIIEKITGDVPSVKISKLTEGTNSQTGETVFLDAAYLVTSS